MKFLARYISMILLGAVVGRAETVDDSAYLALRDLRMQRPPPGDVATTSAFQLKQHDAVSRQAEKLYDLDPQGPHHAELVMWAVNSPRLASAPDSEEEKTRWAKRRTELRKLLLADASVPDNIWIPVAEWTIDDNAGFRERPVLDLAWAGRVVEQMAVRVPTSDRRKFAEQVYIEALQKSDPEAARDFLEKRASASEPNDGVRTLAAGLLRVISASASPLELKFATLSGGEFDLAQWRGKVVLIDFWATWCVPCMKEMPNVRAAYKKYHDRGFEVVGISFDKAPGAKPRAMEKDGAQVLRFAAENDMPWPQYYDGKYWENEIGRRFSINSIPATFLVGKDGRLVTTEAHGEELDRELQRLLGL